MLVLSRKLGESIEIGDKRIVVRVLGIKRSKVQIGVDAPPEVAIHRSEMREAIADGDGLAGRNREASPVEGPSHPTDPAQSFSQGSDRPASTCRSNAGRLKPFNSSPRADSGNEQRELERRRGAGEAMLENLAKMQAEIAALTSLVAEENQSLAQRLAADVSERLAALERSVRCARRIDSEQPISRFLGTRSLELRQTRLAPCDGVERPEGGVAGGDHSDGNHSAWQSQTEESTSVVREQTPPFLISGSPCSMGSV